MQCTIGLGPSKPTPSTAAPLTKKEKVASKMKARNAEVETFLVATLEKIKAGGVENWRSERYNKIIREQKKKPYLPTKAEKYDGRDLPAFKSSAKGKVAQTLICSWPALLVAVNKKLSLCPSKTF